MYFLTTTTYDFICVSLQCASLSTNIFFGGYFFVHQYAKLRERKEAKDIITIIISFLFVYPGVSRPEADTNGREM